jgi:alpha-beta hydrolase superfamily lysophospholipase
MVRAEGFIEKNVSFQSGEINLEGTLVLPKNGAKSSVVLLLPGSGPTDRDENARKGFHKFISNNLKTIAIHLANNGYASYRYDKRGVGKTKELVSQVGFNDIVNDARSAITFLSYLKEIDSSQIFILGHSEGGIVGAILSAQNKKIKGFIGIASPITALDNEVVQQINHILTVRKKSKEKVDQLTHAFKVTFDLMRKYKNWEKIDAHEIKQIFSQASFGFKILPAKTAKKALAKQFRPMWFIQSFDYDFKEIARKISCPVLLLFGEKDYQVTAEEGRQFKKILEDNGNKNVHLTILSDLNHMLRYNSGSMDPKTSLKSLQNNIDSRVLDSITNWLDKIMDGEKYGKKQ